MGDSDVIQKRTYTKSYRTAFITTESVHKILLVLWCNIGGDIAYRVPQANYWGTCPGFGAYGNEHAKTTRQF